MAGAIAQDRERCQFPFVLDEKPTVVSIDSAGERSRGAQVIESVLVVCTIQVWHYYLYEKDPAHR